MTQRLIFSDLTILPSGCDSVLALERLADVLSASPHIALYVRAVHLLQPAVDVPCVWMQSDILPAILSVLPNLEHLNMRLYNWEDLHSNCEQAIYAMITRSALSSIQLQEARFAGETRLLALLRCFPASLESVLISGVSVDEEPWLWAGLDSIAVESRQLRLASLHLNGSHPALFHWAMRVVDPKCLRYLHIMDEIDNSIFYPCFPLSSRCLKCQINSAWYIAQYDNSNLEKMQALRALEISVILVDDVNRFAQTQRNPLIDAMRTLGTAPDGVEHLVLNMNIWDPDKLPQLMQPASRELERLGENLPALRDVVVRIISSYEDYEALQRGSRYLETVFY
ncbi:hypothetical protein B0H16DRAFT_1878544 [Mycena metata]|uniref:Uncharacterized protein n=1 Tax=Mycena metata TaxID=1033252 RepID=A0AAD7K7H1_9AGAR|nr:hypothetical protein B0H16DRAFT_1878544 [Mycena metata]